MSPNPRRSLPALPLVLAVLGIAAALAAGLRWPAGPARADVDRTAAFAGDLQETFAGVAEAVRPGVVFIGFTRIVPASDDDFLSELVPGRRDLRQRSVGSGVIIDRRGYILTNAHVVGDAEDLSVRLIDGQAIPARVIERDEGSDIALLKVDAPGLHEVPMGDSDELKVGHWVIAIGSPFGLTQTVSAGIVSAVGRSGLGLLPYESFIQTDAAINQGNSGGALVDLRGRLIGISSAVYSNPAGGNIGIGFAVPVNLVKALVGKWIQGRSSNYLGIKVVRMDADGARYFGLPGPSGALVERMVKGSPAERDGLEERDVILAFNGIEVRDESHFRLLLAAAEAGPPIGVEVLRLRPEGPERRNLTLTVSDRGLATAEPSRAGMETPGTRMLGITVVTITPEIARNLALPASLRGVAIIEVEPNGPADAKGLHEGDAIVEVNGREVLDVTGARMALDAGRPGGGGEVAMLRIIRGGENLGYKFLPR